MKNAHCHQLSCIDPTAICTQQNTSNTKHNETTSSSPVEV